METQKLKFGGNVYMAAKTRVDKALMEEGIIGAIKKRQHLLELAEYFKDRKPFASAAEQIQNALRYYHYSRELGNRYEELGPEWGRAYARTVINKLVVRIYEVDSTAVKVSVSREEDMVYHNKPLPWQEEAIAKGEVVYTDTYGCGVGSSISAIYNPETGKIGNIVVVGPGLYPFGIPLYAPNPQELIQAMNILITGRLNLH
ncbi:MAG: hypothetical protein QXY05_00965 [Candidatus Anstonellales archaeon]